MSISIKSSITKLFHSPLSLSLSLFLFLFLFLCLIVCKNEKYRADRIEITRRRMQWLKTVPFWLAPPQTALKIDYRSACNDPLRGFEASSSGCNADANWQSLSWSAMNYEPIIHGCRAEFTLRLSCAGAFSCRASARDPGEKSWITMSELFHE